MSNNKPITGTGNFTFQLGITDEQWDGMLGISGAINEHTSQEHDASRKHTSVEADRTVKEVNGNVDVKFAEIVSRLDDLKNAASSTLANPAVGAAEKKEVDKVVRAAEAKVEKAAQTSKPEDLTAADKAVYDAIKKVETFEKRLSDVEKKTEETSGYLTSIWDLLGITDGGKNAKRLDDLEEAQTGIASKYGDLEGRVSRLEKETGSSFNRTAALIAFVVVTLIAGLWIWLSSGFTLGMLLAPILGAAACLAAGALVPTPRTDDSRLSGGKEKINESH